MNITPRLLDVVALLTDVPAHETSSVFRRYDIVNAADLEHPAAKLDQPMAPEESRRGPVREFAETLEQVEGLRGKQGRDKRTGQSA